MMSNVDGKTRAYLERWIRIEQEKRDAAEAHKDLTKEMKAAGFSPDDIAGIKLAGKRSFESEEKRAKREAAEDVAAALGDMASTPLGAAAVSRAAPRHSAPPPDDDEFDPGPALPFSPGNEYHAPH